MIKKQFSLSDEEVQFFNENGYVGPFKVYEPEEVKEVWKAVRGKLPDKSRAVFKNTDINYDRHFDVEELGKHISRNQITDRIASLLGNDLLCWRTEFFSKFPGDPGTEWHQVENFSYASGTPALVPTAEHDRNIFEVTVWTAFTEASKETGCLKFMPGSHKTMYFDESKPLKKADTEKDEKLNAFFGYHYADLKIDPDWEPDESKAVAMEIKPGEAVIFNARCMHGSLANVSKRKHRVSYVTRYTTTDVRVYSDPNDINKHQTEFSEHSEKFDLSQYGTVLVSGEDTYKHNRMRTIGEQELETDPA